MLTKNKIKIIRSLANKKERYSHGRFVIEGEKIINEALTLGVAIEELIVREDLKDRMEKHNNKKLSFWTKRGSDRKLIYTEEYNTKSKALAREKWLKSGVGREYIKNLNL